MYENHVFSVSIIVLCMLLEYLHFFFTLNTVKKNYFVSDPSTQVLTFGKLIFCLNALYGNEITLII